MAKLKKLLEMNISVVPDDIEIFNKDHEDEFYHDPRTRTNENGMKIVNPIAENVKFVWYVCPFCQQIHIESKRCFNVNNKILWANCSYRHRLMQYFIIDCEVNHLAFEDGSDGILEAEHRFMQSFEMLKCI